MSIVRYLVVVLCICLTFARCSRARCVAFFFSQTSFVLFSLVRIPGLECTRSELVSDVPVFFLRAWVCARLWMCVCAGLCVLLCAYACPLLAVCFSVCALGVDLGLKPLFMLEVPSGCLSRLTFGAWQAFIGSLTEHRTPFFRRYFSCCLACFYLHVGRLSAYSICHSRPTLSAVVPCWPSPWWGRFSFSDLVLSGSTVWLLPFWG